MNDVRQTRIGKFFFPTLWLVLLSASPLWAQHFFFAQITDTHVGLRDNADKLAKAIDSINHLPENVECVVVTGDITERGVSDEAAVKTALDTFKRLRVPVHYVAGNHDIPDDKQYETTRRVYNWTFGPLESKAEYNGVKFLMLCTEPLLSVFKSPDLGPLKWLDGALAEAGNKPVIIFTHCPDFDYRWHGEPKAKWQALIKSHNVIGVIAGHLHRDRVGGIGDVPEFVCPACSNVTTIGAYRVYEYTDGKIDYRTVLPN